MSAGDKLKRALAPILVPLSVTAAIRGRTVIAVVLVLLIAVQTVRVRMKRSGNGPSAVGNSGGTGGV